MRKMKIFLSLVVVLLLCVSLTACANEKTEKADGDVQLDAVEVHDDDPQDDPDAGNHDDPIPHDDPVQDEMDGEGGDIPGSHDGYYHEIGDAEFYTEHDLDAYIIPKPSNPSHYCIDLEAMLYDVWGTDGGLYDAKNSFGYSDGSSFSKSLSYGVLDDEDRSAGSYIIISYTGEEQQYESIVTCNGEPEPGHGHYLVIYKDPDGYGFTRDMAALMLYILEQSESNPRSNIASELGLPSNYECGH